MNNLLAKKYTYSNSNTWSNVSLPFLPQLGDSDVLPQASGYIFNHSSWQNRWSSAKFVGFLARIRFSSTVHIFLMGKTIPKTSILAWFSHSFTTFDVCLGSLPCLN